MTPIRSIERMLAVVHETVIEGRPLGAVGSELGLTLERVRQIRNQGVGLMRRAARDTGLGRVHEG